MGLFIDFNKIMYDCMIINQEPGDDLNLATNSLFNECLMMICQVDIPFLLIKVTRHFDLKNKFMILICLWSPTDS